MRIGMQVRVDVSKLDKERFYKGEKGTYADLTAFIDTQETGQYGDNGVITQSTSREERQNGVKMPICGNVRVFYTDDSSEEDGKDADDSGGGLPF